jgi:hypothetical protein
MKRVALVCALTGVLALSFLSSSRGTWAAPWMDPLHQTVPTRTPTSHRRTPRPATPTPEADDDTPAPEPPTATPVGMPTSTIAPTVKPSETTAPSGANTPTRVPTRPAGGQAWDFGDAPDPDFPSLDSSDGARHLAISFEWLGDGVDSEPDSHQIDLDQYDDGVTFGGLEACTQQMVEVAVTIGSRDEPEHPYDAQHLLYLNVLVDWNGDGMWGGSVHCPQGLVASEWAVRNLPIDVSSWGDGVLSAEVPVSVPVGPLTGQVWGRFTLSYSEVISGDDWNGQGAFAYGETEDYLITILPASSVTVAVPSPTLGMSPTSPPDAAPTTGGSTARPSWPLLLCFGGNFLVVGVALAVAALALRRRNRQLLMVALVVVAVLLAVTTVLYRSDLGRVGAAIDTGTSSVVPTPRERLVPTAAATARPSAVSGAPPPIASPTASPTIDAPSPIAQPMVATPLPSLLPTGKRFGFGVAISTVERYEVDQLHAGWYLGWSADPEPACPDGMEYAQMVRVRGGSAFPHDEDLKKIARMNPGSLWLVGNEPDVLWQDGITPLEYAGVYHHVYTLLKDADPTCQVAIGGVSQPTPLRLQYLDLILEAYRDIYGGMMPVDVWNVHAFILREKRGSWGVDIPPGIAVDEGRLYEIEDHDSLQIFRQQIVDFRRWMEERGEGDKPLLVSEYGIVMPSEYGFSQQRVRDFMYATFDFFMTATDPKLGYPPDGDRLVQRWLWYSLSDTVYPTGNLFDPTTGQITALGLAYGSYVASH